MKTAEFNRLMKPIRQKIKELSAEVAETFKDCYVDEEDPTKRLSENQSDRLDAIVEALADAEQAA